ncbi:HEAT repeat domain-containing protein [Acidimicrobium ferrooxidans]|nr:HEAT repeat domain-containing protein [Acidimicrobium ferrooxidans]
MSLRPECARLCLVLPLLLAGCLFQTEPEAPSGPTISPAVTFSPSPGSRSTLRPATAELRSLWHGALDPDFFTYTRSSRQIIQRGPAVLPFLVERLDDRRVPGHGQAIPLAQALIGQILASQPPRALAQMLQHAEPVVRYETARLLGDRAAADSVEPLQRALGDPDPRVLAAVKSALAACRTAGK